MADLVSLLEAKVFMRVEHPEDDVVIATLIAAASDAVRDVATDWDGVGDPPPRLKLAVLTRVCATYENRTTLEPAKGELPMLTPLRTLEV
jgi:hypothetical protein